MGYKYEKQEVPVIAGFECDVCGADFDGTELMGGCAEIKHAFGYSSGHDGVRVEAVLCEPCYYKLLRHVLPDRCFSE